MTTPNRLYLIATVLALAGWEISVYAEGDVTVISPPTTTTPIAQKTSTTDGTPVVHKSIHKKKKNSAIATTSRTGMPSAPASTSASSMTAENKSVKSQATTTVVATAHPQPVIAPASPTPAKSIVISNPIPASPAPLVTGPTVETGLPIAHYSGISSPIKGVSTYSPATVTLPAGKSLLGATTHQPLYASALSPSVVPVTSSAAGSFSSPSRTTRPASDFVFTNFSRKVKNNYPWKTGIITTMFWIGEGSTPISSTTNVQSSWDEEWLSKNHGSDSPYNRNGYASGNHASTLNTFYVALPFNDLAFPDKARRWLPDGWYRRPKDGKQVSACKDRWVWIRNAQGRSCFAQWEDVGPLRYDHAEYVFGNERPIGLGDNHAGLDVSPAVAQYLGIDGKNRITSWRFIDDEDVRPGPWLQLDEQAVLYTAFHQLKSSTSSSNLPIQRTTEPIDDPSNIDSNKKKVDASKG